MIAVNGCGSLAQEGGRSSLGCAAMTPGLHVRVQTVQEHVPKYKTDRQRLVCGVMATLFLLRTVVARSELLLLCMYGARVRDFQPMRWDI